MTSWPTCIWLWLWCSDAALCLALHASINNVHSGWITEHEKVLLSRPRRRLMCLLWLSLALVPLNMYIFTFWVVQLSERLAVIRCYQIIGELWFYTTRGLFLLSFQLFPSANERQNRLHCMSVEDLRVDSWCRSSDLAPSSPPVWQTSVQTDAAP